MSVFYCLFGFTLMKTSLIFYLLILFMKMIITSTGDAAVCFLTVRPVPEMLHFAEELAFDGLKYGIDVFVIVDDNTYKIPSSTSSNVQILQIPNEKCVTYGYQQTMYVTTRRIQIATWDKALLYFCELNTKYSFVWLIEDDVFIPSVHAFRSIHQLYSRTSDLIVQRVIPNWSAKIEGWPHWSLAIGKLVPPWYRSNAQAMGLSQRLLDTIADNVRWRGINTYHEFLPQTLSINLNMTVVSPIEFDTLKWEVIHTWEDIEANPNNWCHSAKNWTLQKAWHQRLVRNMSETVDYRNT